MELINSSFIPVVASEKGSDVTVSILRHIEACGRVCYKSEEFITEDSYKKFSDMLIKRGHTAMLEHGSVYLKIPHASNDWECFKHYPYSYIIRDGEFVLISTNYRILLQNKLEVLIKQYYNFSEKHMPRISLRLICDRGVSHEIVRNRGRFGNAFAQESTRYVNYAKGKGIQYVLPAWWSDLSDEDKELFTQECVHNEEQYSEWISRGFAPQQARQVLNNSLKTEVIVTATLHDWYDIFRLRCASGAHPNMKQLMDQVSCFIQSNMKPLPYYGQHIYSE